MAGLFSNYNADDSWLGRLAMLASQYGAQPGGMTGLASDQAQYGTPQGQPVIQSAPLPAMQQAPTPQAQPMQPEAQPMPAQPLPPALGGHPGGFLSSLSRGLQSIGNGGSVLGAITGNYTDPQSTAQQNAEVTYRNLVPLLGEQQAMIAAINPEIGKTLIASALQRQAGGNYKFDTLPDGTIVRQDPRTGEVKPVYQTTPKAEFGIIREGEGGEKVYGWRDPVTRKVTDMNGKPIEDSADTGGGTVTGPDGKPIAIPPGVDRKTFIKEISKANADAATGKMTETQAKSSGYAARMEQSQAVLNKLDDEGGSYIGNALKNAPLIGGTAVTNWAQSADYERFNQAKSAFITALLRQESGAAISKEEFNRYDKEYFRQPGESDAVAKQKAKLRETAIEQMKRAAGPSYKSPSLPSEGLPNKTKSGVSWSVE